MLKLAIIDTDGFIKQINESSSGSIEEVNARLPEGHQAIECGVEVGLEHIYKSETRQFEIPVVEPPA